MNRSSRRRTLLTYAALGTLLAAVNLLSCSRLRQFYAPDRPDGNVRHLGLIDREPVTDPRIRLETVASLAIPASPITLSATSEAVYLSAATYGMMTVDIRDPSQPHVVAAYQGIITPKDPNSRSFLATLPEPDNERLIVLDRIHGINVWNARDPWNPQPGTEVNLGGGVNDQALSIRKLGGYYYLSSGGRGLMRIPEGFDPQQPRVENLLAAFDHTRDVTFFPPHWLLVADGHDSGMQILDISNEKKPRLAHIFNTLTYCDQIVAVPPYALMASRGMGIVVVDMHEPSRPFFVRYHFPPRYGELKVMTLWKGRYVIAAGKSAGFERPKGFIQVYDMKMPREARLELLVPTDAEVNAIALSGDYLVANMWGLNQLMIFKLSEI